MSDADPAAEPNHPKKWTYGRRASDTAAKTSTPKKKWTYGRRKSEADPAAAKTSRPKKWKYGRPVVYRPPWRDVLRPVLVAAMIVFAFTGLFRLTTVGNPEKFRAQHHAMEIVDLWYAARMSGAAEAEGIRDKREALAFLIAGVDMNFQASNSRVQLNLSNEECEAALSFLTWKRAEGSNYKALSFKQDERE